MNRNIICFCAVGIFALGVPLCAQQTPVEKSTKLAKKDYRIEEEKDRNGHRTKVNLISPDGRVLKSFSPNDVTTAKSGRYLLHQSAYRAQEDNGYLEKEKTLYSIKGEKKWTRTYRSYPASWDPEVGDPSWGSEGISDDGDRCYFNWRDEEGNYCVGVYDVAGKELAKACRPNAIYKVEISPDGKLVGAETYLAEGDKNIKHILFLEVGTGKTRLVKAEGEGWQGGFLLSSGGPLLPGKILLWLENNNNPNSYSRVYVGFSSLSDSLVRLFQNKGEGK